MLYSMASELVRPFVVLPSLANRRTELTQNPPSALSPPPPSSELTRGELVLQKEYEVHFTTVENILSSFVTRDQGVGLLSIDMEQYEHNHSITLEVGISFTTAADSAYPERTLSFHIVNQDQLHRSNGDFCPNNRSHFNHGESQYVPEDQLFGQVEKLIAELTSPCYKVYLVGHTVQSDRAWLARQGVYLNFAADCDVGRASRYIASPRPYSMVGMERMLVALDIEAKDVHNGATLRDRLSAAT